VCLGLVQKIVIPDIHNSISICILRKIRVRLSSAFHFPPTLAAVAHSVSLENVKSDFGK
jgi:hypothetical protein